MSAVFVQRVVVGQTGKQGIGVISVTDARLTPGDVVESDARPRSRPAV